MRPKCVIIVLFAVAFTCGVLGTKAQVDGSRQATVELGAPSRCTADVRDQVTTRPWVPLWKAIRPAEPLGRLEGYVPVDSIQTRLFVGPGEEYGVRFDASNPALEEALLPYELTQAAQDAIETAPRWLRMDLENKFRYLAADQQDRYGNAILAVSDPRVVDEVAFQIAHLSWTILYNPYWTEELPEVNANLMYQIDEELQYVEIVDYDEGGGNFYSTTRYQIIMDRDTTTVEIPREIYYWWIVMPKISDERPLMDNTVYDMFWREYLFYEHDPGYPLLQEVMQPLTVLWDGQRHDWPGARPFSESMLVVDAIGNWCSETVPDAASGNRPIQPNVIAHEHNGNCGELQDLLCAAARTCLVPTLCTMDILEDHVWCEMWWDTWHPYQVDLGRGPTHIDNPGIAYDRDHGGGKDCSCIWDWRNDGFTWDAVATYSQVCTLTVYIDDPGGLPVDNAAVTIASEFYYPPYTLYAGTWGQTGQDGTIQFLLGDNQNYYVKVATSLGNYPPGGYAAIISGSVAGEHYYWNWTTGDEMPQLDVNVLPSGSNAFYVLEVEYQLPYDLMYGRDNFAAPMSFYSEKIEDGQLDFFIADEDNLNAYLGGEPFAAYELAEDLSAHHVYFHIPVLTDYYMVLSGEEHQGLSTRADVTVRLWQRDPAAAPVPAATVASLAPTPNPCDGDTRVAFRLARSGNTSLRIYDASGRLVRTLLEGRLPAGMHGVHWDGTDSRGNRLPAGSYFLKLNRSPAPVTERVLILR